MRLVVVGAGAIGGSVGGRLAAAGHEVVLVARGAHGAAIREHGLRLEAPDGAIAIAVPTVERIAEVAWQHGDAVLLAVKTQDVAGAVRELAQVAPPAAPIACLTNGLEAERIAARWFGDVHAVCVMAPNDYLEPGTIRQWGAPVRGILDVGQFPAGTTEFDAALATALTSAGFASEPRADILRWKRRKLLLNLGNVLEALCGVGARDSELARAAREEGLRVLDAASLAYATEAEDAARRTVLRTSSIGDAIRRGSSTWQSLARGRTLETDYLNGEIALLGRLHGVATPINVRLQRAGAEAARLARAPGSLRLDEL